MADQIGLAVRRMLLVPAKVDKVRRAQLDRILELRRLGKQGFPGFGRARRRRPGLAEILRDVEAGAGTQDWPVEAVVAVGQPIGADVPDAVVHQAAAGIAAAIGDRIARDGRRLEHLELERIVAGDDCMADDGILAARPGFYPVGRPVREGGIEPAIGAPRRIPGIGIGVFRMAAGKDNAGGGFRLGRRTPRRRLRWPQPFRPHWDRRQGNGKNGCQGFHGKFLSERVDGMDKNGKGGLIGEMGSMGSMRRMGIMGGRRCCGSHHSHASYASHNSHALSLTPTVIMFLIANRYYFFAPRTRHIASICSSDLPLVSGMKTITASMTTQKPA